MENIIAEFDNLNSVITEHHTEEVWSIWSSTVYYKSELDIKKAWEDYKTLLKDLYLAKNNPEQTKMLNKEFTDKYSHYESATSALNIAMRKEGLSLKGDFERIFADKILCKENQLRDYNAFVSELIVMGNTMNLFYYKLLKTDSQAKNDKLAEIAYNVAEVMFDIHMECLSDSMKYSKISVEKLIDVASPKDELADKILSHLEKAYDSYNWMVVVFKTSSSSHKHMKSLNNHFLTGFTEISKRGITVAIVRQVRGNHNKAASVRQAIERCFSKTVECKDVEKTLTKCRETVETISVSKTYSAIHAFKRKASHDSHSAKEVTGQKNNEDEVVNVETSPSDQTPYIYTGECNKSPGRKGGKFKVFIKSDEEIMTEDPCDRLDCGGNGRGKCVKVNESFLALCKCETPYYGQHCEQSLEDYKAILDAQPYKVLKIHIYNEQTKKQTTTEIVL